MPDDQSREKQSILHSLGATVVVVKTASYSSPLHYVNVARSLAARARGWFRIQAAFVDQFDNPANYRTHFETTGPEIWGACPLVDAFCMSSGTGGTIAGVGRYLKQRKPSVRVILVDPPGSSLYNKIAHGVAFAPQQSERSLRRHRYDTIAEGIGLDRVTRNLQLGLEAIDDAVQVTDQEALDMAHWLLENEGLWVGSSSAMNVVGAVRTATSLAVGSTVVTLVCDGGQRHVTRFWNRDFCVQWGLTWPGDVEPQHRIPACLLSVAKAVADR
jgi:cysteine synthase A